MLRLLKSIIDFQDKSTTQDNLRQNFLHLHSSGYDFGTGPEAQVFDFIKEFYYDEQGLGELPTVDTLEDYFSKENEPKILDKLKEVKQAKAYIRSQFIRLLKELVQNQLQRDFIQLIKDAAQITGSGKKIDKSLLKGHVAAARHIIQNCDKYLSDPLGQKLKVNIRSQEAKNEFLEHYQAVKNDPSSGMGRLLGLEKIDRTNKGLRKGELMLIAGFAGNMKTTLSLNYAYNTAFLFGYNVYYITLEMSREQVQRILYCIHAEHPLFKTHPKYREYYRKINYNNLRDGMLSQDEEKFLQIVLNDLETNERYGNLIIEKPAMDLTVPDIKAKVEQEHKQSGVDLLFVDEARLVKSVKRYNNTMETLNEIMVDLKQLALKFDGGIGLPVVTPFQTNRQGYREAEKSDGEYKSDCLSFANEAEKSADVIVYTYLDPELQKSKELKIGNLKNRDNPLFDPFNLRIVGESRKLENLVEDDD